MISDAQVARFNADGYVLIKALLDKDETELLRREARKDPAIATHAVDREDGEGGKSRITLWNEAGDDFFGMISRSERVVNAMERFLDGEVYHYHSKMMQKEPFKGGAWIWHQDYGYWYKNGCLFPYMASCFIAVDPCTRENGCLQVLRGSHLMGRIEHIQVAGQTGADPERTKEAEKILEKVYVEMEPGDALIFHCNLLHRSDQNTSPNPRWALICCYNAARNNPYKESGHPRYTPLVKVADSAIKQAGERVLNEGLQFLR
ncbi:MAG: phytanoyl-CoA dioxygenase family protein [Candidatus Hydrogenedentes bacterium]|nr:phytanoyl-CoA dioxygenase family protein [Candidatus Hydrogenedentota bacterium]